MISIIWLGKDGLIWMKRERFKCHHFKVVITQKQGAWSLCKIYLRLEATHAYIDSFSSYYPFCYNHKFYPLFIIISKSKQTPHITHPMNNSFFLLTQPLGILIHSLQTLTLFHSLPQLLFDFFFLFFIFFLLGGRFFVA